MISSDITKEQQARIAKEFSRESKKYLRQIQKLTDENARLKKELASLKKEYKKLTGRRPGQPVFEIVRETDDASYTEE